jgi:hypothetical protein
MYPIGFPLKSYAKGGAETAAFAHSFGQWLSFRQKPALGKNVFIVWAR